MPSIWELSSHSFERFCKYCLNWLVCCWTSTGVPPVINGCGHRRACKLEAGFRNVLAHRIGPDCRRYKYMHITLITQIMQIMQIMYITHFSGIHDCLVPVTPYLSGLSRDLKYKSKPPSRVRATDMPHVLLLMPSFSMVF